MTIDEAIYLLDLLTDETHFRPDPEICAALKLGIEAAKAWKSSRDFSGINHFPLLPGESVEPMLGNTSKQHNAPQSSIKGGEDVNNNF